MKTEGDSPLPFLRIPTFIKLVIVNYFPVPLKCMSIFLKAK